RSRGFCHFSLHIFSRSPARWQYRRVRERLAHRGRETCGVHSSVPAQGRKAHPSRRICRGSDGLNERSPHPPPDTRSPRASGFWFVPVPGAKTLRATLTGLESWFAGSESWRRRTRLRCIAFFRQVGLPIAGRQGVGALSGRVAYVVFFVGTDDLLDEI